MFSLRYSVYLSAKKFYKMSTGMLHLGGARRTTQPVRTQNVTVVNIGKSSQDKMIVDNIGDITCTNDGTNILKQIEIEGKVLLKFAEPQDTEVEDGITSLNDEIEDRLHCIHVDINAIEKDVEYIMGSQLTDKDLQNARDNIHVFSSDRKYYLEVTAFQNASYDIHFLSKVVELHFKEIERELKEFVLKTNKESEHKRQATQLQERYAAICKLKPKSLDDNPVSNDLKKLEIIIDTNVLLTNLNLLNKIIQNKFNFVDPILIIPGISLTELDKIKSNKSKKHYSVSAMKIIRWINSKLSADITEVDSCQYDSKAAGAKLECSPCPDDDIIKCSLYHQEGSRYAVLLSNDINLCNKSLAKGVLALQEKEVEQRIKSGFILSCKELEKAEEFAEINGYGVY